MKKYKFGLRSLLNLKEQTEDLLKSRLSMEREKAREISHKITALESKKFSDINKFEKNLLQTSNFNNITSFYEYLNSVNKHIKAYEKSLQRVEFNILKIANELQQASKEKKVLDRLREKEFEDYKYDMRLEEYKEVDQKNSYDYYSSNLNQ